MNWRRVLIDWPAKAFTAWWTAYAWFLTIMFMAVVTITIIAIVLDQVFGIRWGW